MALQQLWRNARFFFLQIQFLPIQYLIDLRTAKFLEQFAASSNDLWSLFGPRALSSLGDILSAYGRNGQSADELRLLVDELFFGEAL
jgi:hypothetical protein